MPIRIGIVGTDTSHAEAFPKILLSKRPDGTPFADVTIAAFWSDGKDTGRIQHLAGIGAARVDKVEDLVGKVDAVLLENVDGATHLAAARPLLAARIPTFIDKPFTASWADTKALAALAAEHKCPVQSGSSLRFAPEAALLLKAVEGRTVLSGSFGGPNPGGKYAYGIHTIELALSCLGGRNQVVGVEWVHAAGKDNDEHVVLGLPDGRTASLTLREKPRLGFTAALLTDKGLETRPVDNKTGGGWYAALLTEVVQFFRTGKPTLPLEATVEVMRIIEAADRSRKSAARVAPASVE